MKLKSIKILALVLALVSSFVACSEKQLSQETTKNEISPEKKDSLPMYDSNDWRTILVNRKHMLSKELEIQLTSITKNAKKGQEMDSRISSYFQEMVTAAKKEGINLYFRSGFRPIKLQKTFYESQVQDYKKQGLSDKAASAKVLEYTQYPGASEHHTGLALDITSTEWEHIGGELNDKFDTTDAFKWLDKHAAEYGFILRYPRNKENITGIRYEPWHYRYVGKEVATYLKENQLTLEEYVQKVKSSNEK